MKLTFINSQREERELGVFKNVEEVNKCIFKFLEDHNFTSHYTRISHLKTKFVYDVGSWSEFFVLYNDDDVELNKYDLWQEATDEETEA